MLLERSEFVHPDGGAFSGLFGAFMTRRRLPFLAFPLRKLKARHEFTFLSFLRADLLAATNFPARYYRVRLVP
jgi:hypothetical protein